MSYSDIVLVIIYKRCQFNILKIINKFSVDFQKEVSYKILEKDKENKCDLFLYLY